MISLVNEKKTFAFMFDLCRKLLNGQFEDFVPKVFMFVNISLYRAISSI